MKKALLIGGSGFLGCYLLEELIAQDFEVYAIRYQKTIPGLPKEQLIAGGLKAIDKKLIDEISPDFVFHTARPSMPRWRRQGRKLAALKAAWYNSKLIKVLGKSSARPTLVFASGSLMYGSSATPHDEASPLNPISFARQYYKGELPLVKAAQKQIYPTKIFRLPWMLGNGSWFRWFYLENIRQKKAIPAFGSRQNFMEIIDVRDAAKLMLKISLESKANGIFNIPSQKAVTQQQFLEQISGVFSAKIINYQNLYPGRMEKEIPEAYNSSIILKTNFPHYFGGYTYQPLLTSIEQFGRQAGIKK
ncbi:MAG: NAD(P)-dependent oxidoreductase [Bacteroidales bacterium]|nr:NAD(P)-dependent oxidoreductase [Bacteroidales bacterium]